MQQQFFLLEERSVHPGYTAQPIQDIQELQSTKLGQLISSVTINPCKVTWLQVDPPIELMANAKLLFIKTTDWQGSQLYQGLRESLYCRFESTSKNKSPGLKFILTPQRSNIGVQKSTYRYVDLCFLLHINWEIRLYCSVLFQVQRLIFPK